jgi:hypothetical protein
MANQAIENLDVSPFESVRPDGMVDDFPLMLSSSKHGWSFSTAVKI